MVHASKNSLDAKAYINGKVNDMRENVSTGNEALPEKTVMFTEDGSVTFPEVKLSNALESLRYIREQEKLIISKLRESNEYVVSEVKEMLEEAFHGGYHSDEFNTIYIQGRDYKYSPNISDADYETQRNYLNSCIKFLSEYEGSLQNFMDLVAEELKNKIPWPGHSLYEICDRLGITVEELKNMDTASIIEMVKKDIKNIPSLQPTTQVGDVKEHLGAGDFYLRLIYDVCKKFGYK